MICLLCFCHTAVQINILGFRIRITQRCCWLQWIKWCRAVFVLDEGPAGPRTSHLTHLFVFPGRTRSISRSAVTPVTPTMMRRRRRRRQTDLSVPTALTATGQTSQPDERDDGKHGDLTRQKWKRQNVTETQDDEKRNLALSINQLVDQQKTNYQQLP